MDKVKEAFQNIKQEMDLLKKDIYFLAKNMDGLNKKLDKLMKKEHKILSTDKLEIQASSTHIPTHKAPLKDLKTQNIPISIGNQGVPTDRQTDRQTDRHIKNRENFFKNATEMLDSLDSIKKEIRLKFKRLTEQELLIFSTLYQIEEEQGYAEYKNISKKLGLSESSIRDYIGRLIKKGIPVDKKRVNNKIIHLFVSQDLKKIAPLSTILQLRDL